MRWWVRPLVRLVAALLLPVAVPAIITLLIWALPGDPASIICPPESCGGTEALAARWHLDEGPWGFFSQWMMGALSGDFGNSWRVLQGGSVAELLAEAAPNTVMLIGLALLPVILGAVGAASGHIPRKVDGPLYLIGLVPALVLALVVAAVVQLNFGAGSSDPEQLARLLGGALVLGFADGAFSGAVSGVRGLFESENRQRYVSIAILRGETPLSNTLPNVAAALAGQLRARTLHLLSGTVVVEVVLRINGLGDLLWGGALRQDFAVVLPVATGFALLSAFLLLVQALVEILASVHIRRSPSLSVVAP